VRSIDIPKTYGNGVRYNRRSYYPNRGVDDGAN